MSSLIRRQPIWSLQNDMNHLFDRFFTPPTPWSEATGSAAMVLPAADITETDAELVLTMELPGLDAKSVDISVQGDVLTVKGEKKQEMEKKGETWHRVERRFGSFTRSFQVPSSIVVDKVNADFKDGVLRVTMPKAEPEQRHSVKINLG